MADAGDLVFRPHEFQQVPLDWRVIAIAVAFDLEMEIVSPTRRKRTLEIPLLLRSDVAQQTLHRIGDLVRAREPAAPRILVQGGQHPTIEQYDWAKVSIELGA